MAMTIPDLDAAKLRNPNVRGGAVRSYQRVMAELKKQGLHKKSSYDLKRPFDESTLLHRQIRRKHD